MAQITSGSITAFFLFDVAEGIDLAGLQRQIGGGAAEARFVPKSGAPSYFQYAVPPLVVDGATLGVATVDAFHARLKFFDYGVVSLALTRPFSGDWPELVALAQRYMENEALERQADAAVRAALQQLGEPIAAFRSNWLSEDYLVLSVTGLETHLTAEQLLNQRAAEISLLVRGEQQALSPQEQDDILRHRPHPRLRTGAVFCRHHVTRPCEGASGVRAAPPATPRSSRPDRRQAPATASTITVEGTPVDPVPGSGQKARGEQVIERPFTQISWQPPEPPRLVASQCHSGHFQILQSNQLDRIVHVRASHVALRATEASRRRMTEKPHRRKLGVNTAQSFVNC